VIDRSVWRRSGAMSLRRVGQGFEITSSRPAGYERPWARTLGQSGEASGESRTTAPRVQPRDATPNSEDLEAGD